MASIIVTIRDGDTVLFENIPAEIERTVSGNSFVIHGSLELPPGESVDARTVRLEANGESLGEVLIGAGNFDAMGFEPTTTYFQGNPSSLPSG